MVESDPSHTPPHRSHSRRGHFRSCLCRHQSGHPQQFLRHPELHSCEHGLCIGLPHQRPRSYVRSCGSTAYSYEGPTEALYVVNNDSGSVSAFETQFRFRIDVFVDADPVNGDLYISGERFGLVGYGAGVVILNATTWRIVGQVSGLDSLPLYGAGMVIAPAQGRLFLSRNSSVVEVNLTTNTAEGSFGTPQLVGGSGVRSSPVTTQTIASM